MSAASRSARRTSGFWREGAEPGKGGAPRAAVKDRVAVRDRGSLTVKGRTQPVELFELLGLKDGADTPSAA